MWTCSKCGRIFERSGQPHSCHKVPLEKHFENKEKAKELFKHLLKTINGRVGECRVISLPCCIHLFGKYDFLAALPKKEKLEIRFALNRELNSSRLVQFVPMSTNVIKNCIDITVKDEINKELVGWLNESYHLKDKKQ